MPLSNIIASASSQVYGQNTVYLTARSTSYAYTLNVTYNLGASAQLYTRAPLLR